MSSADRIGYLLGALGAAAAAGFLRSRGGGFVLDGPWLPGLCLSLGALSLGLALRPGRWARAETAGLAMLAGVRLAIPLTLTLAWVADGREVWVAVAMMAALEDADRAPLRRWPLVPAAMASALVIGWSATEPRVAPARAVLVALVCAVAAAWSARRAQGAAR
ncbi:MAG: hypothetical protein Q8S73_06675 [Deltaproteobacteria bacterium]|nr:hypothetical protein [Myxococcales bacterium]MDP3213768.1 hypothetical protein [Deltaproteobacteria bacterium]